eukprot:46468-Eustigmatos_ZCMA.PRE.1
MPPRFYHRCFWPHLVPSPWGSYPASSLPAAAAGTAGEGGTCAGAAGAAEGGTAPVARTAS